MEGNIKIHINYDKILSKIIEDEKISYGILFGNEKIVFIKVGADGTVKGYQDKYIKMSKRIHDRTGATVICASNPYISRNKQLSVDKGAIKYVVNSCGFDNYELYFVGTSDGGYHSLLLSQHFPQTVKYIGINSSHKGLEDLVDKIQSIPHVEKIFIYGTEDEDYSSIVPMLYSLNCNTLKILSLEGVDHEFTGRVDEFIALIDLIS